MPLTDEERKWVKKIGTSDRVPVIIAGICFVLHKAGNIDKGKIEIDYGDLRIKLTFEKVKS